MIKDAANFLYKNQCIDKNDYNTIIDTEHFI